MASFLDTVIPIVIAIFFLFIFGRALKKPLGELFNWIRGMFQDKKEVVQNVGLSYE